MVSHSRMTVFRMAEVTVPERLIRSMLSRIHRLGRACAWASTLSLWKTGIESKVGSHAGGLSLDNGKTPGLEVTRKGQSASMPQNPVNRAEKDILVVQYRRWKRQMEDIGYNCRSVSDASLDSASMESSS